MSPGSKEEKAPLGQAVAVAARGDGAKVIHGPTSVSVSGLPESVVKRDGKAWGNAPIAEAKLP